MEKLKIIAYFLIVLCVSAFFHLNTFAAKLTHENSKEANKSGDVENSFNYYEKAERLSGQTGENLMILLERRLDNVIFRLGFARTRKEARQIVDHKHVLVNGKCVNIPSYLVKAGDVVEIKEKHKGDTHYKLILETTGGRLVPAWLESDQENLKGEIKTLPTREEIDVPVNEMLIVELYSK